MSNEFSYYIWGLVPNDWLQKNVIVFFKSIFRESKNQAQNHPTNFWTNSHVFSPLCDMAYQQHQARHEPSRWRLCNSRLLLHCSGLVCRKSLFALALAQSEQPAQWSFLHDFVQYLWGLSAFEISEIWLKCFKIPKSCQFLVIGNLRLSFIVVCI